MLTIHAKKKGELIFILKEEFDKLIERLKKIEEIEIVTDDFVDLIPASSSGFDFRNNKQDV